MKNTFYRLIVAVCSAFVFFLVGYAQETGTVMSIGRADFLKKIYDYEKNDSQFVYEGNIPCIVDFYADWCPPCKVTDPILRELAEEYNGRVLIYKINVDKEKDLARAFGISSIPTFLFIPVKGSPSIVRGALPKEEFVKAINSVLL